MSPRILVVFSALLACGVSVSLGQDAKERNRHPVPDAGALDAANKLVREIYGKSLAAAQSTTEKQAVLAKMIADSAGLDDPTDEYALMTAAAKLAVNLGDVASIERIVASLAKSFEIDKVTALSETLLAVNSAALSAAQTKAWCGSMVAVADDALRQRNTTLAERLLAGVSSEISKARDKSLVERFTTLTDLLGSLKAIADNEAVARKTLGDNPGDAKATMAVAEAAIVLRNDWATALDELKKAHDPALVTLAELELKSSPSLDDTLAIAAGWRGIAQSAAGIFSAIAARRAQQYYERALPNTTGLQRAQVQKQIAEVKELQPSNLRIDPEPLAVARPASPAPSRVIKTLGMTLVLVPAGQFTMGSHDSPSDLAREYRCPAADFAQEVPVHSVTISREFYLSAHEVTVRNFQQFIAATRYKTEAERRGGINRGGDGTMLRGLSWKNPGYRQTDDHPVVAVSWNDAQAFCEWLSTKERATFRLPTEAEWEYAARAGSQTRFLSGADEATLQPHANIADESARLANADKIEAVSWNDGFAATSPVGQFRPNLFGLYDMAGNVWEWCEDRGNRKYTTERVVDPVGKVAGDFRPVRGGSFDSPPRQQRVSRRGVLPATEAHANQGFRVVRVAD